MKILMVLTSHDKLGNTGRKTGFWLEELAAPYYAFKDAGAEITLASPEGGNPPLDPKRMSLISRLNRLTASRPTRRQRLSWLQRFVSTAFHRRISTPFSIRAATVRCGIWQKIKILSP